MFSADLASRPVERVVHLPPPLPDAPDSRQDPPEWFRQARTYRWSDDDIVPVLAFLREHPAHDAKVFRLAPSVRRETKADGPWERVPLPAAHVALVERDRIVVRDCYGAAVHFGPSLPAWARCALAFGWDSLVIDSLARAYRPWETVTIHVDRLVFTPPEGSNDPERSCGWWSSNDDPPSITRYRPETFAPVVPAPVDPLVYPETLRAVYDAWTAEDEAERVARDAIRAETLDDTAPEEPQPENEPPNEPDHYTAYTDGSGSGAGGDTGLGVVVLDQHGQTVLEASRFAGPGTNNTAELCAIWCAILIAPPGHLTIITDSEYSQGVLLHPDWRLKANEKLIVQIRKALAKRVEQGECEILHVHGHEACPEEHKPGNGRADYLAGLAVDRERTKRGQSIRRRKVTESPTVTGGEESWHNQTDAGKVAPVQVAETVTVKSARSRVVRATLNRVAPANQEDPTEIVVCDTETTGFGGPAATRDRLVELAAVVVRVADLDTLPVGGDPRDLILAEYGQLVHPGCAIPPDSTDVHHITNAMVVDAPRAKGILPSFVAFLQGRPLLFHNARYDRRVISGELKRADLPGLGVPTYCSLLAAKRLAVSPDNKLPTLTAYFGVPSMPTHRALADIVATVGVLAGLRRTAREMGKEWRLPGLCGWKGETL
jgi:DNA polymerase III epsilon subunit-like protein/ribonuclease HI